jgi:hypothetical protein
MKEVTKKSADYTYIRPLRFLSEDMHTLTPKNNLMSLKLNFFQSDNEIICNFGTKILEIWK